ncbi:MAG TPA: polysaccharide deacetylase family protein, partial [Bacillota bacterium]|nr:polysaccharide deacetylase family protein [Bacillota bacterium]
NSIENWAVKGVVFTGSRGISSTRTPGYFAPKAPVTRGELAVMLAKWLQFNRKSMVPVLTYHHVVREGEAIPQGAATIGEKAFASQMQLLVSQGYHTITTDQLENFLSRGIPLPEKPVMVTFDDGYRSNYNVAFPIMKRLGIKGVINVVVSSTPGENAERSDIDPVARLEHLTWQQMQEMVNSGLIEIQSHTYNSHGMVRGLGGKPGPTLITRRLLPAGRLETAAEYQARITQDLTKARLTLEKHLGMRVTALAYPYGSCNADTDKAARAAGYTMTFSSVRGLVGKGDSLRTIKRINVAVQDDLAAFQKKLLSGS